MLTIILLWILGSIITYGGTFGYHQRSYPSIANDTYWGDMAFALGISLFAPMTLPITFFMSGFYHKGFKFI